MCLNISSMLVGFTLEPIKASDLLEDLDVDSLTRKMIKLLDKQVIVNAWSYAGDGCFNENGDYIKSKIRGCYNYKIEYKDLVTFNEHLFFIDQI